MNCRACTRTLSLLRDGRLDDGARAEVERHLQTCESCRTMDGVMRVTGDVMVAAGPADPPAELAARVARVALTSDSDADADATALWRWWLRIAAPATALGVAAAVVLMLLGGPSQPRPGEAASEFDPIGVMSDADDGALDATMLALEDD